MKGKLSLRGAAILGVFATLALIQVGVTAENYALPWGRRIWHELNSPARDRSARLSPHISAEQAAALEFLRLHTLPDSTLVFTNSHPEFDWTPYFQYFLMPRTILICDYAELSDCRPADDKIGVLYIQYPGFPAFVDIPPGYAFVRFVGLSDYGYFADATGPRTRDGPQ